MPQKKSHSPNFGAHEKIFMSQMFESEAKIEDTGVVANKNVANHL